MSYTEICDKFDVVKDHILKGTKGLSVVCSFFKSYCENLQTYNENLAKLEELFQSELPKEGNMDTLSMALFALVSHVKKITQSTSNFAKSIQHDIVEPLELFADHFTSANTIQLKSGSSLQHFSNKSQSDVDRFKKEYYESSELFEKANQKSLNLKEKNADKEEQDRVQREIVYYRDMILKQRNLYMQAVNCANQTWKASDENMINVMESLQQSEESRVHFIKSALEKYVKHYQKHQNNCLELIEEINSIVWNINSSIDVMVFVDVNRSKPSEAKIEKFVSYEEWKKLKNKVNFKEEDYEILNLVNNDPDQEHVSRVLNYLLNQDPEPALSMLESMNYSRLSQILGTVDGRGQFIELLEHRKKFANLDTQKLVKLSQFLKEALTGIAHDNLDDPSDFIKIINLAHSFYTEDEQKKRIYLASYMNHSVFSDKSIWLKAIECAIDERLETNRESIEKNRPKFKDSSLFGTLKQIASIIPFQKDPDIERAEKSAAFMIMSYFSVHMVRLNVPIEIATSILVNLSKKYNLDYDRTCILLSEIKANQKSDLNLRSKQASASKQAEKWGNLYPVFLALEYLDSADCLSVLQVSRRWKIAFRNKINKKFLLTTKLIGLNKAELRKKIWVESLKTGSSSIDYFEFLERGNTQQTGRGDLNDIIDMDVSRSYQNNPFMPHQILKNLLRAYSAYNPDVGYCQGMNYIAGTLYSQIQEEELTFKCLIGLIEKYQMKSLFKHNLPKLRQFFYQMDRLTSLILPEIHDLFNEVGINSAHFCASWFLTLFSSILQTKTEILLPIWDMFILDGWKSVFKCAIVILKRVSVGFKDTRFEEIMALLSMIQQPNCPVQVFDDTFIEDVASTKISNSLLKDLEAEYEELKIKATYKQK